VMPVSAAEQEGDEATGIRAQSKKIDRWR